MGQSTSTESSACVDEAACFINVVSSVPEEVATSHQELPLCTSVPVQSPATAEIPAKVPVPDAMGSGSAVTCRKCAIIGVNPEKYCMHFTAKLAQDVEEPDFDVTSLSPGKFPAFIWHMLTNLSIVKRFKISRIDVLNLVNSVEFIYKELEMSAEWIAAMELAHAMYVILRRQRENGQALDCFFLQNNANSAPSIGDGTDRLQGLSLIFSALVSGLDNLPSGLRHQAEKVAFGADWHSRKSLPWRVIRKAAKPILNRLLESEEQRVEVILTGIICAMNDPTSFEEYAKDSQRPRLCQEVRRRSSFDVASNPCWNVWEQNSSSVDVSTIPVHPRRPQAGDLHDTCMHIEPVGSKLVQDSKNSSLTAQGPSTHMPQDLVPISPIVVCSQ